MTADHDDTDKPTDAQKVLQRMVCECNEEIPQKSGQSCKSLGTEKHDCVDEKIKEHNSENNEPTIGNEAGWTEHEDHITGEIFVEMIGISRGSMRRRRQLSGTRWPDSVSFDSNGNPEQIFDFKFKCPSSTYPGMVPWGSGQKQKYRRLTHQWGKNPDDFPPTRVSNTDC